MLRYHVPSLLPLNLYLCGTLVVSAQRWCTELCVLLEHALCRSRGGLTVHCSVVETTAFSGFFCVLRRHDARATFLQRYCC